MKFVECNDEVIKVYIDREDRTESIILETDRGTHSLTPLEAQQLSDILKRHVMECDYFKGITKKEPAC